MADTTTYQQTLPREEVADHLQALAREIRNEGPAEISVGNKRVTLTPDDRIEYDLKVEERSPMLKGKREEVTLKLKWGVKKETKS